MRILKEDKGFRQLRSVSMWNSDEKREYQDFCQNHNSTTDWAIKAIRTASNNNELLINFAIRSFKSHTMAMLVVNNKYWHSMFTLADRAIVFASLL